LFEKYFGTDSYSSMLKNLDLYSKLIDLYNELDFESKSSNLFDDFVIKKIYKQKNINHDEYFNIEDNPNYDGIISIIKQE
jgi:hypothetical protein